MSDMEDGDPSVVRALRPVETFGSGYLEEIREAVADHYRQPGYVLEWGAGHSTGAIAGAVEPLGCLGMITVDHKVEYLRSVLAALEYRPWLQGVAIDLVGPKTGDRAPECAYTTLPLATGLEFSFILIDGRRRLECATVAALVAAPDAVVLLHDYRRGRYQAVQALFDVVRTGEQFLVLRTRPELASALKERVSVIRQNSRPNPAAVWILPGDGEAEAGSRPDGSAEGTGHH